MDPVRWYYGSNKGELINLLVVRGHVWVTQALVDTVRGPLMDPVRGREWIQYGDTYGPSEGVLVDLLVIRRHLWITGFGYCAGVLMDQVRGREWIHYGGAYLIIIKIIINTPDKLPHNLPSHIVNSFLLTIRTKPFMVGNFNQMCGVQVTAIVTCSTHAVAQ